MLWVCDGGMVQHVVDAVLAIRRPKEAIDLHMVEIMEMQHKTDMDTSWVVHSVALQLFYESYHLAYSCAALCHVDLYTSMAYVHTV